MFKKIKKIVKGESTKDKKELCEKYITIGSLYKDSKKLSLKKYIKLVDRLIDGFEENVNEKTVSTSDFSEDNIRYITNKEIGEWLSNNKERCRSYIQEFLEKKKRNEEKRNEKEDIIRFLESHKYIIESIPIEFKTFSRIFINEYPIKVKMQPVLSNISMGISKVKNEVKDRNNQVLRKDRLDKIVNRLIFKNSGDMITNSEDYTMLEERKEELETKLKELNIDEDVENDGEYGYVVEDVENGDVENEDVEYGDVSDIYKEYGYVVEDFDKDVENEDVENDYDSVSIMSKDTIGDFDRDSDSVSIMSKETIG